MSTRAERMRELVAIGQRMGELAEEAGQPGAIGLGLAIADRLVVLVHEAEYDAVQEAVATYAQLPLPLDAG